MMHMQAWRVLASITVEIKCNHAEGQQAGSHLVYRETVHDCYEGSEELMSVCAAVWHTAASKVWQGEVETFDECGWA